MPRKRSERKRETPQEQWERKLTEKTTPTERELDTYEEVVEFYTAYLCGSLDTLAAFTYTFYAADARKVIKETVESIMKDAWALDRQGRQA
ncbi:unnamed protein product [marine sediment metagenome]|uniref:Uncharacterized protein n=1 Tax=marine sediment metagenome TaxID=412755 RepID=X1PWF4_9ZZZZ